MRITPGSFCWVSHKRVQAMLLTAAHSDIYAGVVGLSPGGPPSLADQLFKPRIDRTHLAARCVFIHGQREVHAVIVPIWAKACNNAGWQFQSKTHPGAHHFPADWDSMQIEVAKFLKAAKP